MEKETSFSGMIVNFSEQADIYYLIAPKKLASFYWNPYLQQVSKKTYSGSIEVLGEKVDYCLVKPSSFSTVHLENIYPR